MLLKHLLGAALLLGSASPSVAQSVNAGIEAWQRGNYASAVSIWRPLAEHGDADAQFNLGQSYRLGRGVPTNLSLAKSWLEKAARQNHVDAETTLGLLLFQNGDQAGGLKWLKMAAVAGEARAMLVYGTALFNGDSVTQDPIAGYAYVYRANAQGLPAAKDILGELNKLLNETDRRKALAMVHAADKADAKELFAANAAPKSAKKPTAKIARTPRTAPRAVVEAEPTAKPVKVATAPTPKPAVTRSAPAPALAAAGPATGGWRIQVGAFNDRASAEAAYRKLAGNAALAGRSPQYIPFKQFIRLRIGPFASKAGAASACSALHTACYPVAPGQ